MKNDFDKWNEKKKRIDNKVLSKDFIFNDREIWWGSLGKNIGSEQNGKNEDFERPLLIFRIFGPDILWVIPLTTRKVIEKSRKEYSFIFNEQNQTLDISQLRLISAKRLVRFEGIMSYDDFQNVRKIFSDLS